MDRRSFLKLFGGAVVAAAVDPSSLVSPAVTPAVTPERRYWQVNFGEPRVSFDFETQPTIKDFRQLAKVLNFGMPSGMSPSSFVQALGRTRRFGQQPFGQPDLIIFDEAHRLRSKGVAHERDCVRKWSTRYTPAANYLFQGDPHLELGRRLHEIWEQSFKGYAEADARFTSQLASWTPPEPPQTLRDSFRKFLERYGILPFSLSE